MVSWALAGRHGWDAMDVVGGWAYAAWAYASLRFAAALLLGLECCCCCLELAGGRAKERKDQRSDAWLAWVWAPLGSWHACAVMLTGKRECRARPEGEESPPRGRRQWQLANLSLGGLLFMESNPGFPSGIGWRMQPWCRMGHQV